MGLGEERRRRLVNPIDQFTEFRPALFSLAYRILGQRADAEDVLQETFLRWQAAPVAEIHAPKQYLMRVVGRLALDALKMAYRKREQYIGPWLPEPLVDDPAPVEIAESLSLAFLHVLEKLSPTERVAFLLHEVFDSSYAEVAEILESSEANCRQLVTRARQHLRDNRPRFRVDPERHAAILKRFLLSCSTGDSQTLTSLLKEDVVLYADGGGRTRAALNPIFGADRVQRFLFGVAKKAPPEYGSVRFTQVNGEPGAVFALNAVSTGVVAIDIGEHEKIQGIYWVVNPEKLGIEPGI